MRQIQIGNTTEKVVERSDYPPEKLKAILGKETVAVLGYGVQGRGQSLNMKDNGVNVLIGLREKGRSWGVKRLATGGFAGGDEGFDFDAEGDVTDASGVEKRFALVRRQPKRVFEHLLNSFPVSRGHRRWATIVPRLEIFPIGTTSVDGSPRARCMAGI